MAQAVPPAIFDSSLRKMYLWKPWHFAAFAKLRCLSRKWLHGTRCKAGQTSLSLGALFAPTRTERPDPALPIPRAFHPRRVRHRLMNRLLPFGVSCNAP